MPTDLTDGTIWLVIVAAGVGTLALRLSFILLFGRIDTVPPRVVGVLRYVPAAVLAALVAPAIVSLSMAAGDPAGLTYDPVKVVAGAVAAVVAWRTESVLYTIAVGMGVLWALTFLF